MLSEERYMLINGNIIDSRKDKMYIDKTDIVDLLNQWSSVMDDFEKICDESIYMCDTSRIWDCKENSKVKRYSFYELLTVQSDRIGLLEEELVDVECEVEMLEEENRRLKEMNKENI